MIIHIDWQGPFTEKEARDLDGAQDFGLYQWYGHHPVYGLNSLLYIGKAEKQTFGQRLRQENWEHWNPEVTTIYVGRISSDTPLDVKEWERQINLAERIIIFSHSPAFNTASLNNIRHDKSEDDVRVFNWGMRRCLLPEVSISRWTGGGRFGHKMPANIKNCYEWRKSDS